MIPVKLQLVLFTILVTIIISARQTYRFTNHYIGEPLKMPFLTGEFPTSTGILVHSLVAGILMYLYLLTFRV